MKPIAALELAIMTPEQKSTKLAQCVFLKIKISVRSFSVTHSLEISCL